MLRFRYALIGLFLVACGGTSSNEPEYTAAEGRASQGGEQTASQHGEAIPDGQLPTGVSPLHYSLYLEVVPSRDRFSGRAEIRVQLDEARSLIWLHGQDMNVTEAEVIVGDEEPIRATFRQENENGVASLRTARPIGPGEAVINITYDAPYDRQLKGLYRVDVGSDAYAFTQFEATSARFAFPCFDEPRFKTPFDMTLAVPEGQQAVANTRVVAERSVGNLREVRFATTERLPTYLVAMAVGPLDIVEYDAIPPNAVRERPLPLRGVAARGRGPELAYALEHTAAILADLENYFGTEYPYDKLDIIAVPDFASGAMENAGAVTFRETLLLLDPDTAPERQRRAYAYVMAHELAHQWFGNLVTMPWWDDIWLNEAFATWMGNKVVRHVFPEHRAEVGMVGSVQSAMRADSLTSARQIRQPIESDHDIRNAFDSITYRKGGGVLEMFERFLGEDTFREGIREYMNRHRFATADADDFLDAISQMAGQDVSTPFRTFLFQPGVPLLSVERVCGEDGNHLRIQQSRYFPVGSSGERTQSWQIPVCIRYGVGNEARDTCALITEADAHIDFEGDACPDWVMPNADAAGYFRFAMNSEDLSALMQRGWSSLTERERLAVADNLNAAFQAAAMDAGDVFGAFPQIASDASRAVATSPMDLVSWARANLVDGADRARLQTWAGGLYAAHARRLGWEPRRGANENGETGLFRNEVLSFLASTAQSEGVRTEAARRGRAYVGFGGDGEIHSDAVANDLVRLALTVAVQESDADFFDHLLRMVLASEDALFRSSGLVALGQVDAPTLSERAMALSMDARLRVNEMTYPIRMQLSHFETRERAWPWFREHFDAIYGRAATTRAGYAPWALSSFCSEGHAVEVENFFADRIEGYPGGPRNLRGAVEVIRLCGARVNAQQTSMRNFIQSLD